MLSFQKKFSVYCHRDHLIIGYLNSSQSDNDQIDSLLFKQYHKMEPNSLELIKKLQNLNKVFEEDLIEIFFFMNTKQIYFNMPTIEYTRHARLQLPQQAHARHTATPAAPPPQNKTGVRKLWR